MSTYEEFMIILTVALLIVAILDMKNDEKHRFLIVDDMYAYHLGASIKDAGKKCFGINIIEDNRIIKDILERLRLEVEGEVNAIATEWC